jgi:hypothetical protein
MKTAVIFLTVKPFNETIAFASLLKSESEFDVFIVADSNDKITNVSSNLSLIQIDDKECASKGYTGTNINSDATHIKKDTIAFDKMLHHFCEVDKSYDFVWIFEDDVFIPNIDVIKNLHNKYSQYDLITSNNTLKDDDLLDWHWRNVYKEAKIGAPYYYSMACGIGMSKQMLESISKYANEHKKLFYVEVMLNTIAMQSDLIVCEPFELKSIVWMGEWNIDEFLLLPENVFHPKKDIAQHPQYRLDIAKAIAKNKKPKNKLPKFIKQLM